MPAPVVISPAAYVSPAATTIAATTDTGVAAGETVVAVVAWYGSGTLDSLSGGGLDWTVHVTSGGTAHRIAIASAHAPAGMASGTTVTATLSASRDARSIRLVSVADVAAVSPIEGTDSQPSTNTPSWVGTITTSGPAVLIGAPWYDFYSAGLTVTSGTKVSGYEWVTSENSTLGLAYLDAPSAGSYTVSGTGGNNGRTSATIALSLAGSGPTIHDFSGTVSAISGSAGGAGARRTLAGTVAAITTTGGSTNARFGLLGTVTTVSGISGSLGLRARLGGTVNAVSSVVGSMGIRSGFSGTVAAVSGVVGALNLRTRFAGIVSAISQAHGNLAGGAYYVAPFERTYGIPCEDRTYTVSSEDRIYRIEA